MEQSNVIASIIQNNNLQYPSSQDFFSPDEYFPEYIHRHISRKRNDVYRAVRECLAQAGLDRDNFGKSSWNPLREVIREGSKVFVLCNFVHHKRDCETDADFFAKCTHGSVVRAVLDYVLLAIGNQQTVCFGNAPIQSCDWDRVLEDTGAKKLVEYYERFTEYNVTPCDLRSYIIHKSKLGGITSVIENSNALDEVEIDIGKESFLEDLYSSKISPNFRILDYNPTLINRYHGIGKHIYLLSRKILEADVILSIPKLKTHEKVGITLGLKGCVGGITRKHCLAHYRLGSPCQGGDEYPNRSFLSRIESVFSEYINKKQYSLFSNLLRINDRVYRKAIRHLGATVGGGWARNDTAWRMSLDIARIFQHASKWGVLQKEITREHFIVIDGVIGGEGHGPLKPNPVRSGFLLFSKNPVVGDYIGCHFMGFDPDKVPIIKNAWTINNFALTTIKPVKIITKYNGSSLTYSDLYKLNIKPYKTISQWKGYVEK